jgi:2'-5' RNA ligase
MTMINQGGHAVMLNVEPDEDTMIAVRDWVAQDPARRVSCLGSTHVTLCFVGRNQPTWVGDAMHNVVIEHRRARPTKIRLTGEVSMFGAARDHLVALVDVEDLAPIRSSVLAALAERGIRPKSDFGEYRPHVTIARTSNASARISLGDASLGAARIDRWLIVTDLVAKVGSSYRGSES